MIKYIFIIGFICLVYVVIFALLKAGSDFDDEVEELYNNFYEDDGLDEEYDYYDNKYKELIPNGNCYYWKRKPTSIMHQLLVNEVYIYLKDRFDIIEFEIEYPITYEDFIVRADIYFSFRYNGREWDYLIEVENNKGFNYSKYLKLEEGGIILPKIIVLTDRRIYNKTKYEVIKARLNLSDLENKVKQDIIEQDFGYKIKG